MSYDNRLLTGGTDFTFNFNDNVTITRGAHTIKVGGDVYRIREYEGEQSTFSGTFDFGKNTLNPLDTNYAFSNAALGVFNSYTESNARYGANMRQTLVEWFAQDSWKVSKRFNVDYGIRWTWAGEMNPNNPGQQSVFMRNLYNASQAPPLYVPVTQNGVKYAQNPLTGALLPVCLCGSVRSRSRQSCSWRGDFGRQECSHRVRESAGRSLGTAPWLCLRRVRQRQDGHPRRRCHPLQSPTQ